MANIGDSIQNLPKIDKFHKNQGKSTAAQKSATKIHFSCVSELLVRISKKHQKSAHFIGGFCTFRGLPISIWSIFHPIRSISSPNRTNFMKILGLLLGPWKTTNLIKIAQKQQKWPNVQNRWIWWKSLKKALFRLNYLKYRLFSTILGLIKTNLPEKRYLTYTKCYFH